MRWPGWYSEDELDALEKEIADERLTPVFKMARLFLMARNALYHSVGIFHLMKDDMLSKENCVREYDVVRRAAHDIIRQSAGCPASWRFLEWGIEESERLLRQYGQENNYVKQSFEAGPPCEMCGSPLKKNKTI